MKKTNRKRLGLEREVVKVLMAAIPQAKLKHVQGGTLDTGSTYRSFSCQLPCSNSCAADSCYLTEVCEG